MQLTKLYHTDISTERKNIPNDTNIPKRHKQSRTIAHIRSSTSKHRPAYSTARHQSTTIAQGFNCVSQKQTVNTLHTNIMPTPHRKEKQKIFDLNSIRMIILIHL